MRMSRAAILILVLTLTSGCGYARLIHIPKTAASYAGNPTMIPSSYTVGVAKNILTPPENAWLAGFNRGRASYGIYDTPEVRALALSDGQKVFVFITLDAIGLQLRDVMRVREAVNIPGVQMTVDEFSSHTHSAPDTIGLWGNGFGPAGALPLTSGRDENYLDQIVEQSAKTIASAVSNMKPASLVTLVSNISDLSKNRREPKILDREISLLTFYGHGDEVIGQVVNFGCHPESQHRENHLTTADFVAPLRDALDESRTTTTLFVNGSLGGMVQPNLSWAKSGAFKDTEKLGRVLAAQALDHQFDTHLQYSPIVYKKETVKIPLENKLFWWAGFLGFMPFRGNLINTQIETEVSVLRLDKATIVMVPGEIVPELGLEIKRLGGPNTLVWSLANDEIGYILKKEKFYTDTFKYERTMSLGLEAGPIIMRTVERLLKETAK